MKIYWYCPDTVNESFKNPTDNPSFRLRCWSIHNELLNDGYASKIVNNTSEINDPDIIVLMSFGEEEYNLAKWAVSKNKSVIHDYSENIRGIPILEETKSLCKYIVCCSTVLGEYERYYYGDKVIVVKDIIEEFPVKHNINYTNKKLKVVWSGMSGNTYTIDNFLKEEIINNGMDFIEISNREFSNYTWDINTWYHYMASCDICICPHLHWLFPAKSNVKVTTAMALGLPVIASPIQSYEEVIDSGVNGFICDSFDAWTSSLNLLKSKELRCQFVNESYKKLEPYKLENIYKEWKNVFKKCLE